MKYPIFGMMVVFLLFSMDEGQVQPEKRVEDGVEVVANHMKPYKIEDQPRQLNLEKFFSINTADETMLTLGLTEIETFDVDSKGNIFIIRWRASENYVFKFDSEGKFVKSFVRRGQGPGEIEWGGTLVIDSQDKIIAKDPSKSKFLVYDNEGNYLREGFLSRNIGIEAPLPNGGYLISWQEITPELGINHVGLCDSGFGNIRTLAVQNVPNPMAAEKIKVGEEQLIQTASKSRIYVGYSGNGYEIKVYDLEGKLFRKIRKKYDRVKIQEDEKRGFLGLIQRSPDRDKYFFADYWPAFRYCFVDEEERLFIMTYEKGKNLKEAIYDVFNSEGIFIARTSFSNVGTPFVLPVRAKKDHIYCLREVEEGYKELVVYKAYWK